MTDLSILITTSFIKSHPSTEMIEETIRRLPCNDAKVLIVCDGFKVSDKPKAKSGTVTQDDSLKYKEYLDRLLILFPNYLIIIRDKRYGYAGNLKYCLGLIETNYVMIVQHDQYFIRDINIGKVAEVMENTGIKYIGFPSITNNLELQCRLVNGKFRKFLLEFQDEINRHLENPDINVNLLSNNYDEVNRLILEFTNEVFGLPLMPLVFFYDKPHIMRTSNYIALFDNHRIKEFPEDTVGHIQKDEIARNGLEGFYKYSSFLLYDNFPDVILTAHSNGRSYILSNDRQKMFCDK